MQYEGLPAGTVVAGKYVVERTLGRGGMGAVYVVSHASTGKRLAMKCLLAELIYNADLVGRFLREAQVMGRLQHRHVVDVFDVGRDGDVLYIVMELLEGKPLSELLHDSSITLEEALVILLRAMEGVAAAHSQGVIHRDLKPDNIYVCVGASGRLDDPRVLDFGISKLEEAAGDSLTSTGMALGTPYYMSIEQLKGQRDLDARVDVYALGVILYEAIAGEPPFVAETVSALAIKVITTEPVHLSVLRPDLPPGLADVVMKALSRDREDRQRSVRALIEALRAFVPKSAGLLVPEGQGRPLRTPRHAGAHRASESPPPVDARSSTSRGSERAAMAATTPLRAQRSEPAASSPVVNAKPRGSRAWALALVLTVALGGAALYRYGPEHERPRLSPAELPATGALPLPTPVQPERAVVAPTQVVPESPSAAASQGAPPNNATAATPAVAEPASHGTGGAHALASDAGLQAPDQATNDAPPSTDDGPGTEAERSSSRKPVAGDKPGAVGTGSWGEPRRAGGMASRRQRAGRSSAEASHEATLPTDHMPIEAARGSELKPTPTPAAPPRKSAEGRAGMLGSDEF
ncbi:MAG: protein kinase [Myxococcaceae bacterium]|nr:protein kinase [Myxococcaceae bacterium]